MNGALGITYLSNGKVVRTPDRPLIRDLDTLPFPTIRTSTSPGMRLTLIAPGSSREPNGSTCRLSHPRDPWLPIPMRLLFLSPLVEADRATADAIFHA